MKTLLFLTISFVLTALLYLMLSTIEGDNILIWSYNYKLLFITSVGILDYLLYKIYKTI